MRTWAPLASVAIHGLALAWVAGWTAAGGSQEQPPTTTMEMEMILLPHAAPAAASLPSPPPRAEPPAPSSPKHPAGSSRHSPVSSAPASTASPPSPGRDGGETGSAAPVAPDAAMREPPPADTLATPSPGNDPPVYPASARRLGRQGRVVLRATIDPDGTCASVQLIQTSGIPMLDEAALAAVGRWRFAPATRGGSAITSTVDLPITFRLTDSET